MEDTRTVEQIYESMEDSVDKVLRPEFYFKEKKQRIERLGSLGLLNSPEYKRIQNELNNEEHRQKLTKEEQDKFDLISETRRYYEFNYPSYKFLTEKELHLTCDELNLEFDSISKFRSDLPEHIIDELEDVQPLEDSRVPKDVVRIKVDASKLTNHHFQDKVKIDNLYTFVKDTQRLTFTGDRIHIIPEYFGGDFKQIIRDSLFWGKIKDLKLEILLTDFSHCFEAYFEKRNGLFIAAPHNYFKGDFSKPATSRETFIVYRYCVGGVQVLSSWDIHYFREVTEEKVEKTNWFKTFLSKIFLFFKSSKIGW